MWKLHIRQIAKVTETKDIAETGDIPDVILFVKIIEMVELPKNS